MASDKKSITNLIFSEGILLALLTAVSYIYTYSYEKGFFSVFDLPEILIEVNINTVLYTAAWLFAILFFVTVFVVQLLIALNIKRLGLIAMLPSIFLLLVTILMYGFAHWREWLWLLVIVVVSFLINIPTLMRKEYIDDKTEILDVPEGKSNNFWSLFLFNRLKSSPEVYLLAILLIVGIYFSYSLGKSQALRETSYLVVNTEPESVVLRIYGDKMLCSPVNKKTRELSNKLLIFKVSDNRNIVFSRENIGPLHVAP